jgi:hypothetical protein
MNDREIIQAAYAAALEQLFADYLSALAGGAGDAAADATALANFRKGVALARRARGQALAVVGQS